MAMASSSSSSHPFPEPDSYAGNKRLPEDVAFDLLLDEVKALGWSEEQQATLTNCYGFSRAAHDGQKRKNGDNYIVHPVEVATILAKVQADEPTILAALMHDVLEDTSVSADEMEAAFGPTVLHLVQGVTKLGRYKFSSKEEQQAENFRRMFLSMAQDVRVITLKLADRLHNMRTLFFMRPDKQVKIAKETLDIFAPLANRMGMGNFRAELEDLSLKYIDPEGFQTIEQELAKSKKEREATIQELRGRIKAQIKASGLDCRIYGRLKNYYSIYKKMKSQQKDLNTIYDISALRVIVETEPACYEVLGIIHNSFTPVAGRFKDYIAMPKSNFYQSLHTTIIGPLGRPVEVQIRTRRMHEIAEYGIAAHFKYKEAGGSVTVLDPNDQKLAWLKQITEMKQESETAQEFVENVRLDLFPDEVFVFTPKGEVVSLPKGSTPVDFAFRIHTEVGNRCSGSIVNERIVPLDTELNNGDMVEIITNKKANPRLDWVHFCQTNQAKSRIRQWYKKHFRDQHEAQGRHMLEAELSRAEFDQLVKEGHFKKIAKEVNYKTAEDLFVGIGYGETPLARVLNRVRKIKQATEEEQDAGKDSAQPPPTPEETVQQEVEEARQRHQKRSAESKVLGLKGLLYNIARCCMPVPGDEIAGIVTRSRGVMVHRADCVNTLQANPARLMKLSWDGPVEMRRSQHPVALEITSLDRLGLLSDLVGTVSKHSINIVSLKSKQADENNIVTTELSVEVADLTQLEKLLESLRKLTDVMGVKRRPHRPNARH